MPDQDEDYLKKIYNLLLGVAIVAGLVGIYWFATRNEDVSPAQPEKDRAQHCQELASNAYSLERAGRTGDGALDETMDGLAQGCPAEYAEVVDFFSGKTGEKLDDCCTTPGDSSEDPWEKYVDEASN